MTDLDSHIGIMDLGTQQWCRTP